MKISSPLLVVLQDEEGVIERFICTAAWDFTGETEIFMKKNILVKGIVLIIFIVCMAGILFYANHDRPKYTTSKSTGIEYETAKVLKVVEDNTVVDENTEGILRGSTVLDLKILTGRYKGNVSKNVVNYFSSLYNYDVKEGDTVSIRIDTLEDGKYEVSIYNYNRKPLMIGLVVIFFLALLLIGGKQGAKAFLGLVYTVICIVFILLPLCLKGFSPIPITCAIIFVTSAVCFFLIGGIQKKTVIAAIGSFLGVICAALFAALIAKLGGVTSFQMEDADELLYVKNDFDLHMRGLLISGILIAAMGAVMDVAMTISSAIEEVHLANESLGIKALFKSGMKIGRDAMGTMANTLILAYVGSSLNMMIMIYAFAVSFNQLVNTDFVAVEMIRAISGSIGIILTVPCVALLASIAFAGKKKNRA